jgi:hypothetical protein
MARRRLQVRSYTFAGLLPGRCLMRSTCMHACMPPPRRLGAFAPDESVLLKQACMDMHACARERAGSVQCKQCLLAIILCMPPFDSCACMCAQVADAGGHAGARADRAAALRQGGLELPARGRLHQLRRGPRHLQEGARRTAGARVCHHRRRRPRRPVQPFAALVFMACWQPMPAVRNPLGGMPHACRACMLDGGDVIVSLRRG